MKKQSLIVIVGGVVALFVLGIILATTVFLPIILSTIFEKVEAKSGYRISVEGASVSLLSGRATVNGVSVESLLPSKKVTVKVGAVDVQVDVLSLLGADKTLSKLKVTEVDIKYTTRNRTIPIQIDRLETESIRLSHPIVDGLQNTQLSGRLLSSSFQFLQSDDQPEGPSQLVLNNLTVADLNKLLKTPLQSVSSGFVSLRSLQTWQVDPAERLLMSVDVQLKDVGVDISQDKNLKWATKLIQSNAINFSTDFQYSLAVTEEQLSYDPNAEKLPLKERLIEGFETGVSDAISAKEKQALRLLEGKDKALQKQLNSAVKKEEKKLQKEAEKLLKSLDEETKKEAEKFLKNTFKGLF